jgi:hypothetical protein
LGIVSFRVDDELKKEMERLKTINWSEVLRQFVADKIREELTKPFDPVRRVKGSQLASEIQARQLVEPGWDSTEEIRKWRDQRR